MSFTKSKYSLFPKRNRYEEIIYYQPELEEALFNHGWIIKRKHKYSKHFWFLELWTLQSQWSPTDLQLFLMFEDEDYIYSAAIALEEPREHHSADWKTRLYLKRGWKNELSKFMASLGAIRDNIETSQE